MTIAVHPSMVVMLQQRLVHSATRALHLAHLELLDLATIGAVELTVQLQDHQTVLFVVTHKVQLGALTIKI